MNPVFMMLHNESDYNTVVKVEQYIAEKLAEYIETKQKSVVHYSDGDHFNFSIDNFDSVSSGLKANYDDFYSFKNINTGESYIISTNQNKLRDFCAYINRLTN